MSRPPFREGYCPLFCPQPQQRKWENGSVAGDLTLYREFESFSLQRGVRKLSVPRALPVADRVPSLRELVDLTGREIRNELSLPLGWFSRGFIGDYLAVPDAVRNRCLLMCFEFDGRGDSQLLDIIDRAEGRGGAGLTTGGGGPQQGSRDAAGRTTVDAAAGNAPAAAGGGQAAPEERDQYLAAMLAAHEPESPPVKEGTEREVAREPSQKHGRSRKNN
jgi:hypothetical protein